MKVEQVESSLFSCSPEDEQLSKKRHNNIRQIGHVSFSGIANLISPVTGGITGYSGLFCSSVSMTTTSWGGLWGGGMGGLEGFSSASTITSSLASSVSRADKKH